MQGTGKCKGLDKVGCYQALCTETEEVPVAFTHGLKGQSGAPDPKQMLAHDFV